ncbi:unnamed protein product [Effrenium voratum]|nr:unnamed protein product [Effrenium voratum]
MQKRCGASWFGAFNWLTQISSREGTSAPRPHESCLVLHRLQECKCLTIVSGGRNPIRDYVASILEAAESRRNVLLRARLKAIQKAISVAEVAARCSEGRGFSCNSKVNLLGMREEGPARRDGIQIEIRLAFSKDLWQRTEKLDLEATGRAVKKDFDQLREDYEDSRKAVHILNEAAKLELESEFDLDLAECGLFLEQLLSDLWQGRSPKRSQLHNLCINGREQSRRAVSARLSQGRASKIWRTKMLLTCACPVKREHQRSLLQPGREYPQLSETVSLTSPDNRFYRDPQSAEIVGRGIRPPSMQCLHWKSLRCPTRPVQVMSQLIGQTEMTISHRMEGAACPNRRSTE